MEWKHAQDSTQLLALTLKRGRKNAKRQPRSAKQDFPLTTLKRGRGQKIGGRRGHLTLCKEIDLVAFPAENNFLGKWA